MYLTLSKRFEFSSSHRYYVPDWDPQKNRQFFGRRIGGPHGYGNNFTLYTVFHGAVDARDGMIINVTTIKKRVNDILSARYDHKFLNVDTPPFDSIPPTPENLAACLFEDIRSAFSGESAQPVVCHLEETDTSAATAYADGRIERHFTIDFSAARRTVSPHLTDQQNRELFGKAVNIHGHGYRLRVTLDGPVDGSYGMIVPPSESERALSSLYEELDHHYLNDEVSGLQSLPVTTETLARYVFDRLGASLPVSRVRLHENPRFFAEFHRGGITFLGIESSFHAAHRLHSSRLTEHENVEVYDKCNNAAGHGHLYRLEATVGGTLDERSGTLFDLDRAYKSVDSVLETWRFRHLDLDTDDFRDRPSTAENMVTTLWPRLQKALDNRLWRARMWETPNNRFTVRRQGDFR